MFREVADPEQIRDREIKDLFELVKDLGSEVYSELGAGFPEEIYQKALQLEMREKGIRFQREVNIEIFYKNVPIGFDRPDFIVRPFSTEHFSLSKPVVVELKAVKKLNDGHKIQAKTYLVSLPHSSDGELKACRHCILVNFPSNGGSKVEMLLIEREVEL